MEIGLAYWLELTVAAGVFVAGVAVGLLYARGGQGARARARRLETQLRETQEQLASYEDRVAKHFAQTSDLFGDLTRQYTAVWDHLAEGARDLCAERVPALGHGFNAPPLLLTRAPGEGEGDRAGRESELAAEAHGEPEAAETDDDTPPEPPRSS